MAQVARTSDPKLKIIFLAVSDQGGLNSARDNATIDLIIIMPFTIRDLERAFAALLGQQLREVQQHELDGK